MNTSQNNLQCLKHMLARLAIDSKNAFCKSLGGGIGRHRGLKIPRLHRRAGSSPARGTILNYPLDL